MYNTDLELQPNESVKINRFDEEMLRFIITTQSFGEFYVHKKASKKFGLKRNSICRRIRNLRKKGVLDQEQVGQHEWVYFIKVPLDQIKMKHSFETLSSKWTNNSIKSFSNFDSSPSENLQSDLNDSLNSLGDDFFKSGGADFFPSAENSSEISNTFTEASGYDSGGDFFSSAYVNSLSLFNFNLGRNTIILPRNKIKSLTYATGKKAHPRKQEITCTCGKKSHPITPSEGDEMGTAYEDLQDAIFKIKENGHKRAKKGSSRAGSASRPQSTRKYLKSDLKAVSRKGDDTKNYGYWKEKHEERPKEEWTVWNVEFEFNENLRKYNRRLQKWGIREKSIAKALLKKWGGKDVSDLFEYVVKNWERLIEDNKFIKSRELNIHCIAGLANFFLGSMDREIGEKKKEDFWEIMSNAMNEDYMKLSEEEKKNFDWMDSDGKYSERFGGKPAPSAYARKTDCDELFPIVMKEFSERLGIPEHKFTHKDYEDIQKEVDRRNGK